MEAHIIYNELDKAALNNPSKCALDFLGKKVTYKELREQSLIFAASLVSLGIKKGDRVAIVLPNCVDSFICFYGILYAGAIVVNISCLASTDNIESMLKQTQTKVMITSNINSIYEKVSPLINKNVVEHYIIAPFAANLPVMKQFFARIIRRSHFATIPHQLPFVYSLSQLLKNHTPYHIPQDVKGQDIAVMQFSGGTTGVPKAVVHTHHTLLENTKQIIDHTQVLRMGKEVFLGVLPFFHIFALMANMLLPVSIAARIVIIPKLDYELIITGCIKNKVTVMTGVPSVYAALNRMPKKAHKAIESMRFIVSGGAPLENHIARKFYTLYKKTIIQGYGLTEAPVLCLNPLSAPMEGTIGLPFKGVNYKIVPLDGSTHNKDVGELVIKAPQVMLAYWKNPKETKNILREGWLHTGDIVTKNEKGYLVIVDRAKDLIITSGFNVFPSQVEQVFYKHESVEEVLVVGVKDPLRGQAVHAYVKYRDGFTMDNITWNNFLKRHLSDYEVPRKIISRKAPLPRTAVGKLSRQLLLEELQA